MHVLFLEIDTERAWAVASLGPSFLAGFLRRNGHEASLFRVAVDGSVDDVIDVVAKRRPGLIGVSLTSRQWLRARDVVAELHKAVNIPVVAGGLHATFAGELILSHPGFDFTCLGEGEVAMLRLVQALESGVAVSEIEVPNIWRQGSKRPLLGKPFEPIDELPWMERDMLDETNGIVHMTTQRGCPFPCTYCAARMFDELYRGTGQYGRRRSHGSVLAELDFLRQNGPVNYVIFLDDTFTLHPSWVTEFCRQYGEQMYIPFSLHARVETVTERMIGELADAGCRHITYGVESGSERHRREVMKRPVTNQKIIDVFRLTKKAGIITTANYMLGMPEETPDEMQMTIDLHHQLQPDDFGYFVFYPYPGTQLFHVCEERGYLPHDYYERPAHHRESILNLPTLTRDEIADCFERWTEIRVKQTLQRSGSTLSELHQANVREMIETCAGNG